MRNARIELLEILKENNLKIKAAIIWLYYDPDNFVKLQQDYTKKEFEDFLNALNFEYHDGYGTQELYGIIYCEEGKWLTRREYDGAESWELHMYPSLKYLELDREELELKYEFLSYY